METARQLVTTLFGLLIAYLLPGLLALLTIGLVYEPIGNQLISQSDVTAPSGMSVLLFLVAILAGVQLNVLRWVIYAKIIGRKKQLTAQVIAALGHEQRAEHYHLLLDQVLRFHQFSGSQSIVLPCFVVALTYSLTPDFHDSAVLTWYALAITAEVFTIWSAVEGWSRYVDQATALAKVKLDKP